MTCERTATAKQAAASSSAGDATSVGGFGMLRVRHLDHSGLHCCIVGGMPRDCSGLKHNIASGGESLKQNTTACVVELVTGTSAGWLTAVLFHVLLCDIHSKQTAV